MSEINDGGPAFGNAIGGGMSYLDYVAAQGAAALPIDADEELWQWFRANSRGVQEAIEAYDEYMAKRDFRYAETLVAERSRRNA